MEDIMSCANCGADAVDRDGVIYVISTPRINIGERCKCGSNPTDEYEQVTPFKAENQ
jgi:hypothetical protein